MRHKLIITLFLMSCGAPPRHISSLHGDYAGEQSFVSLLGMGFDRNRGIFTGTKCVEHPTLREEKMFPSGLQNRTRFLKNVDFKGLLNSIYGSFDLSVPVLPGITAGGGITFARDFQATNYSENYMFAAEFKGYSLLFPEGQTNLSEIPKKLLINRHKERRIRISSGNLPEDGLIFDRYLENACGSEYISQIDYGATLNAILHINYGSSTRKSYLAGRFKIDALKGTIKVSAEAAVEIRNWREEFQVTVAAFQHGGNPRDLARLLPENILICGLDFSDAETSPDHQVERITKSLQPCLDYFKAILEYAGTDFSNQLADQSSRLKILNYHTTPYDHLVNQSDEEGNEIYEEFIVKQPPNQFLIDQSKVELFNRINEIKTHLTKAKKLEEFMAGAYDDATLKNLHYLLEKTQTNAQRLLDVSENLLKHCWHSPFNCLEAKRSYEQMIATDPNRFQYPTIFLDYDVRSLDFVKFCEFAFQTESSLLTTSERYSAKKILAKVGINDVSACSQPLVIPSSLDLTGAGLSSLNLLGSLSGIENLNVSNNRFAKIDVLSLLHQSLTNLNLSYNPVKSDQLAVLSELSQLKIVDLSGLGLQSLSKLKGNWHMAKLILRDNLLDSINITSCLNTDNATQNCASTSLSLPFLEELDLRKNYLSQLSLDPRNVGSKSDTVKIYLSKVKDSFECPDDGKFQCIFTED